MSSREIAELTGKEHRNILRDARAMLVELHGDRGLLNFEQTYRDPQNGQEYPVLALPKRETLILTSGYSVQMRARIVDRWQELEETLALALPKTFAAALRLAAEQAEQIEAQQQALALAAPKVDFVDRYVAAETGCKGIREVCKILGANERRFVEFIVDRKMMYRLGERLMPHANHLDAGRFVVKTGERNGHAFSNSKFTPRGVEWIAGEWGKRQAAAALADMECPQ